MKSIATRLAVWYALAATLTLASLSLIGYFALRTNLIHGLDLVNAGEFRRVESLLLPGEATLDSAALDRRVRTATQAASVLFFVVIRNREGVTLYSTDNLGRQSLPASSQSVFNAYLDGIGELRAAQFQLNDYHVTIATPERPVLDLLRSYVQVSVALVAIMATISIAIGFFLSHFALRPVHIIEETANRIRSDNLSERIPGDNLDAEVAKLATLLNQMFDRLESSFNQIRRFASDASHELKTPLSLIRLQAERMIQQGSLNPAHEEAAYAQLEEVARLNKIIDELLLISRAEARAIALDCKPQRPDQFLQTFAQDARVLAEHRGVRYEAFHEGDGDIAFDAQWIRQVLLNLLTNAINASPEGGVVAVRSKLGAMAWRVSVEDQGPGVPADALSRIFDRFVRLNADQNVGTGLGLAICRSIMELHRGRIWAEQAPSAGLRVTIELPMFADSM